MMMPDGVAVTATEETVLPCPLTFTEPAPVFVESCFDVAITVSAPEDGAFAGAV